MVWYKSTQADDNRRFNKGRFPRKEINPDALKDMYYSDKPIKANFAAE